MGIVFIIIGCIFALAFLAGGAFLGYLMQTMQVFGEQYLYQFLTLDSVLVAWLLSIAAGIVLAAITGLPLILGGKMYLKGTKALKKARKRSAPEK